MDELKKIKENLANNRAATWETLPDIELYKDQVLNYMQKQYILQSEDDLLTGAMINNYIKSGLLPRAKGKKYTKEHLAFLTAICSLKQVLSVGETDFILKQQSNITDAELFYNKYWLQMNESLTQTANSIDENLTKEQLAEEALRLAIDSYTQKLACKKILDILKD